MELVRAAFSPVPILVAPWLQREVVGPEMLDLLQGVDPLEPCCFRFSAPVVEKIFENWSKASPAMSARESATAKEIRPSRRANHQRGIAVAVVAVTRRRWPARSGTRRLREQTTTTGP